MHTFDWQGDADNEQKPLYNGSENTRVVMHHNGDYSGNVKFVLPYRVANTVKVPVGTWTNKVGEPLTEVNIPFEAMKSLVLNYLRDQQISALENLSDENLERFFVLGLP
jgi:hypothetical protein